MTSENKNAIISAFAEAVLLCCFKRLLQFARPQKPDMHAPCFKYNKLPCFCVPLHTSVLSVVHYMIGVLTCAGGATVSDVDCVCNLSGGGPQGVVSRKESLP